MKRQRTPVFIAVMLDWCSTYEAQHKLLYQYHGTSRQDEPAFCHSLADASFGVCCIIDRFDAKVLCVLRVLVKCKMYRTREVRLRKRNKRVDQVRPSERLFPGLSLAALLSYRLNRVLGVPCSAPFRARHGSSDSFDFDSLHSRGQCKKITT